MTKDKTARLLRAVEPVQYERQRHGPGSVFFVDDDTAARLIAGGDAVEAAQAGDPVGGHHCPPPGPPGPPGIDARTAQLIAAIGDLRADDPDHWTTSGKPKTEALAAASGLDEVSAAERDDAWATVRSRARQDDAADDVADDGASAGTGRQ